MPEFTELWHNKSGKTWFKTRKSTDHLPESNLLTVKASYSLISPGTERTILLGNLNSDVAENMGVPYMQGSFNGDFTYGYSLVGKVIDGPAEWKEKYIHVMHPHQEMAFVRTEDVYPIPEELDLKTATLASNMETAINAVWDSEATVGDRVLIVGGGIIGLLTAFILQRIPGTEIRISEINTVRRKIAEEMGFPTIKKWDNSLSRFDIAIHTSGTEEGLQSAIDSVGLEGRIIEMSWYGPRPVSIMLGKDFHYHRKKIISSQVSHIPAIKCIGYDYGKRKSLVFRILQEFDFSRFIRKIIPFGQAPKVYNKIRHTHMDEVGLIFKY